MYFVTNKNRKQGTINRIDKV